MGFWRSLRRWWNWDGSPDTDPFRSRVSAEDGTVAVDVSGHAHASADTEPAEAPDEEKDA
jgi:hypothetical protein